VTIEPPNGQLGTVDIDRVLASIERQDGKPYYISNDEVQQIKRNSATENCTDSQALPSRTSNVDVHKAEPGKRRLSVFSSRGAGNERRSRRRAMSFLRRLRTADHKT
jgi:hypothetical protein